MKMHLIYAALVAGALSLPTLAFAQGMQMGGEDMPMKGGGMIRPSNMSMMQDLGPSDENYDLRFINIMIMHREGAITMAQDALQKSKRPEIRELSKQIIVDQQKEIARMKTWRKAWYQK